MLYGTSYFLQDKALFGSYPSQDRINELEKIGTTLVVNLTLNDEKHLSTYILPKTMEMWRYRIIDQRQPQNVYKFCNFIRKLSEYIDNLKENEKIYIHCRGGHGRSGLVVSSLLIYRNRYTIEEAINLTNLFHRQRIGLSDKWHRLKIPNYTQINYLYKIFNPIVIQNRPFIYKSILPSFIYKMPIKMQNESYEYNSLSTAFYAFKDLNDLDYVYSLISARTFNSFMKIISSKRWDPNITQQDKINRIVSIIQSIDNENFLFNNISSLTEIYCDIYSFEFDNMSNVIGQCYKKAILNQHLKSLPDEGCLIVDNIKYFD